MTKNTLTLFVLLSITVWSCNMASTPNQEKESKKAEKTPGTKAKPQLSLHQAAFQGDVSAIEKILNQNVEADLLNEDEHTPIMLAAFNGHINAVKLLLENGASLNKVDKKGLTPLHFAASGPYPETVELLIEKGANINAIDSLEHFTPLMYAAAEGNIEVVKLLIEKGADKTLQDTDGDTAANFARQNGHPDIVELLE